MIKLKIFILITALSLNAYAGMVNGIATKVRTYEYDNHISFESKIPNLTFKVRKIDVLKAMTKIGELSSVGNLEKNGIIQDINKKIVIRLERVNDGLRISSRKDKMFITEKELDKIKKK
ncbi:MAG: hypothetical protein ACRCXY_11130 [Fusobacteriaceae bacterium]